MKPQHMCALRRGAYGDIFNRHAVQHRVGTHSEDNREEGKYITYSGNVGVFNKGQVHYKKTCPIRTMYTEGHVGKCTEK